MIIETKLKKWGNSIGIVVPKNFLMDKNLKDGEEVIVDIFKKGNLSDVFGSLPDLKLDSQKMKDEIRKEEARNDRLLLRHLRNNRNYKRKRKL